MLQFNKSLCSITNKLTFWKFTALFSNSTAAATESANVKVKDDRKSLQGTEHTESNNIQSLSTNSTFQKVMAVLQSSVDPKSPTLLHIKSAQSVDDLLNIVTSQKIPSEHCIQIMSIISNIMNDNKVSTNGQVEDRLVKLRKHMLKKRQPTKKLNMDERLEKGVNATTISQLSTTGTIKVMLDLAAKQNRDPVILQSISHQLLEYSEVLTLRDCSNILYSMVRLNYVNIPLLEKVITFTTQTIPESTNCLLISSLATSMGMLRYKNENLLDTICDWMLQNPDVARHKDVTGVLHTIATLGHKSDKAHLFIENIIKQLTQSDIQDTKTWIDFVWSLVALNEAEEHHVSSVLEQSISAINLPIAKQLKVLNINAAAKYILKDYKGPLINSNSALLNLPIQVSTEKQRSINAIKDTLNEVLKSSSCYTVNVNTKMGFLIDVECHLDAECNPLPYNSEKEGNKVRRIAMMACNYSDYCRGEVQLTGMSMLCQRLLENKGYVVLNISYDRFCPGDKAVKRVKYLKDCIKSVEKQFSELQ